INNADGGIFYEISQDVSIHDNYAESNGLGGCGWLWGGGITIAASFNVEIFNNTLVNNCNGITGVQQTRTDSTPPEHLVDHMHVHDNSVSGAGRSGVISDNGTDWSTRDITYINNMWLNGHVYCGTSC